MSGIPGREITSYEVIGTDGREIGEVVGVTVVPTKGILVSLLVEPTERPHSYFEFASDEENRLCVPVSKVSAVDDYIIVERS